MEGLFNVVVIFGLVMFCDGFSSKDINSSLVTKTMVTTAKVYDADGLIAKPTSFAKTIYVEHVEQPSSTPYELFGITGPQRRNLDGSIWDWNYWCQLQRKKGKCYPAVGQSIHPTQRYYYVAELDTCKKFVYSGCAGNKNNFETFKDCERNCKGAALMTLKDTKRSIYCSLQPNVGMCLALMERLYFDVEENKCKTFIYGGCGGNQNRFNSIELCEKRCKNFLARTSSVPTGQLVSVISLGIVLLTNL